MKIVLLVGKKDPSTLQEFTSNTNVKTKAKERREKVYKENNQKKPESKEVINADCGAGIRIRFTKRLQS